MKMAMAENTSGKKRLRILLIELAALVSIGYALALAGDLFIFILYFQLAFLFFVIFTIKIIFRDYLVLGFFMVFVTFFILEKTWLWAAFGILFIVLFVGRSLIKARRRRMIFIVSAMMTVAAIYLLFIFLPSPRFHPLPDQSAKLERLQSLPYAATVAHDKNESKEGVAGYDRTLSAEGLNLYNSYYKPEADLLDMSGKRLHVWRPPGSPPHWHCVTACSNGDILVCAEDESLMRLDWESRVLWKKDMRAHHDITIAPNEDIYTLTSREEIVFMRGLPIAIINDYIVRLSPDGAIKKEISLFGLMKSQIPAANIFKIYSHMIYPKEYLWRIIKQKRTHRFLLRRMTPFDVFHNNSVSLIDRNLEGIYKKGNILVCANALDLIGIVDIESQKLGWTWGPGNLDKPHNPTLLENGHILIFDNGTRRGYSRLVELDPRQDEIVWEYHPLDPESFFTDWGGSAQRLPNGNTLVTETSQGRVFEITQGKEIVWEFFNPDKGEAGRRATIYRLTRITDPRLQSVLMGK